MTSASTATVPCVELSPRARLEILGAILLALFLFGYLLYALLKAEEF